MSDLNAQQAASAKQFEERSAHYGRTHILAETSDVASLLEHVPPEDRSGEALDVATGGGHTALCLARAGYSVTLGDLSLAMLKNAARLLEEEGFPKVSTAQFPAELMPFEASRFGLVSCRVAPHHFSDPGAFVAETARVLRPGGWFLLIDGSVPDEDPETADWLNAVEKWRDPSHGRLLSRREWEQLAKAAGLKVVVSRLEPMLQPDLEWYFAAAGTSPENQEKVRSAIASATPHVRAAMELSAAGVEPVRWTWQRLMFLARKAS